MPSSFILKPCSVNQQALAPTEAGWHCARCQTEVIDFTLLTETEVLAYLAARPGQRVCAAMQMPLLPQHPKRSKGPRRWLLALTALWGWQSAEAQMPLAQTQGLDAPAARPERIVLSGVVLDDSLNVPVPGLWLYINHTKYGAITNEQGGFSFAFPADWKPVRGGIALLQASPIPYTFKPLQVSIAWRSYNPAHPLTLRLASAPGRGRPNLKGIILRPAPVPPPVYPASLHTARH